MLKATRSRRMDQSNARKKLMQEYEMERRRNEKPSDLEQVKGKGEEGEKRETNHTVPILHLSTNIAISSMHFITVGGDTTE